ncbi:2-oxoacid:acceptor oxidoreductase family protein [bacterium]|nr:2-oxoacid:acceptor oxidoreductase family protein [bacterium]
MLEEVVIAGFGGQGVVFCGTLLCCAGMREEKEVCGIPSYGAEMRGGTANYSVVISEEEIASPLVFNPTSAIIMNQPSLDKFEPKMKSGGLMILNSSLVTREIDRADLKVVKIPATLIATELGNERVANMVALGAYLSKSKVVLLENAVKALSLSLSKDKQKLLTINEKALRKGFEIGSKG